MKVNDVSKVYGVYENKLLGNKQPYRVNVEPKSDKLSLSNDAKDYQAVMKGLKEASDIREDKVQEVSRRYEDKSYRPDYREVAAGLLNSGIIVNRR
jgi:negative regulator of flagellin synthesis FlgM